MAKEKEEKLKVADDLDELLAEAKRLGITPLKVSLSGLKDKSPKNIEREEAKAKKELTNWLKGAIAKAKAKANLKPIDKRKALLVGRFKAIRSRKRTYTYTNKLVEAWTEEYEMIKANPKEWNRVTENGTKPFNPGNKRKKTAKELLDAMDLDS